MICKMIAQAGGNKHDIAHFLKVYTYARLIGEKEQLDVRTQETLEITAVIHDIACPLCWEKYGNASGKHQEQESAPLVEAFLEDTGVDEAMKERISYLVCHHHTYEDVDGNLPGKYYVEIQLRTIAMDTWAELEHKIRYKKDVANREVIASELKRCADELASCDLSMQTIRDLIR